MKPYIDRILCLLPFEVAELERLASRPVIVEQRAWDGIVIATVVSLAIGVAFGVAVAR